MQEARCTADQDAWHPDYGFPTEMRLKALKDAELFGVQRAADLNGVSAVSVYKWRQRVEPRGARR